jgi:FAD/FMN-containing dehydrogenase
MAKEDLTKVVGTEHVFDDEETLQLYATDESFTSPGRPWCVVMPKTTEEVQQIVQWANQYNEPLTPVSSPGGPRFHGDTIPSQGGVMVDLSGMNKILNVHSRDKVAMVEPGVTFDQLESVLRKNGMRALKPLLPRKTKSVLTSYLEREPIVVPREQWDTTDPLICVEVVFGTGDRFRTGSAAQGPGTVEEHLKGGATFISDLGPSQTNFSRVLQGAQGTLGIVTWASVACERLPAMQKAFFIVSDNPEPLIDLSYRLTRDRIGEELFILNGISLATILGDGQKGTRELRVKLPPWVLFLNLTAPAYFPEEKMSYQEKEVEESAQALGLELQSAVEGFSAKGFMEMLDNPPDEYYKTKYKGGCQDIFFITTLDKTPGYIAEVRKELRGYRYPATDIGIYLQPRVQGCSCHCEFSFPYDPSDRDEKESLRTFLPAASGHLAHSGAFFSRPYGPWADIAYRMDAETTAALRKVKGIFDPMRILNPGKLCY